MARVELCNVTKIYDRNVAVDDLSVVCEDSELLVLLGPAGAGKTSTLKMICGVESVSGGMIYIGGREVNAVAPEKRNVGMVFENYALYPHMSVFENMAFPLRAPVRVSKSSKTEIAERVTQVARTLQIEQLLQRMPTQLSGGQRQRVGLGRALVRNPDAMLLDEPIAHLDAKLRNSMRGELKRLQKETGVTTLYATPDYAQALGMADRIAVLYAGKLQQLGPPMEIYGAPANVAVAGMLSDPKINLLECQLHAQDGILYAAASALQVTLPSDFGAHSATAANRSCLLAIRPNDIRASRSPSPDCPIPARIQLVEPIGSRMIVTVETSAQQLKLKVPFDQEWKTGEPLWLGVPPENVLLFDKDTGANLRTAPYADVRADRHAHPATPMLQHYGRTSREEGNRGTGDFGARQ